MLTKTIVNLDFCRDLCLTVNDDQNGPYHISGVPHHHGIERRKSMLSTCMSVREILLLPLQ